MGLMMGRTKNWSAASCKFPREWGSSAWGVAGMGLSRLKVSDMECLGVLGSGLTMGPMLEGRTGMGLYGGGEEGREGVGGMGLIMGLGAAGSTKDPLPDRLEAGASMGLWGRWWGVGAMGLIGGCTWSIFGREPMRGSEVGGAGSSRWGAGVQGMGLMRGRDPLIRGSSRSSSKLWGAWVALASGSGRGASSLLPLQKLLAREGMDFKLLNL